MEYGGLTPFCFVAARRRDETLCFLMYAKLNSRTTLTQNCVKPPYSIFFFENQAE
jgi:hypothetical protein